MRRFVGYIDEVSMELNFLHRSLYLIHIFNVEIYKVFLFSHMSLMKKKLTKFK